MAYLKTFLPYLFGNKEGESLGTPLPDPINWHNLCFEEILMFKALDNSINPYVGQLDLKSLSKKDLFQIFNFYQFLSDDLKFKVSTFSQIDFEFHKKATKKNPIGARLLQELLDFDIKRLTVFVLLNPDRKRPGTLIIRNKKGEFFRDRNQNIWSIPILGLSGRHLPFNHSNGNTPTGIFSLDSVMPNADKEYNFGKFRRLIINFINEGSGFEMIKNLLPANHHQLDWWKSGILGRILGRHLLRIHGTGLKNLNPLSTYYPFYPTSGCLATREASFFGLFKTIDQRLLLDALMEASDLDPIYENESKIHGLLYVVELDDNLSSLKLN